MGMLQERLQLTACPSQPLLFALVQMKRNKVNTPDYLLSVSFDLLAGWLQLPKYVRVLAYEIIHAILFSLREK